MSTCDSVNQYISQEILGGRVELAPDDDLLEHPSIDSLAVMSLVTYLEQHFEISVPPEDVTIDHFRTVRAISTYVDGRKKG